MAKFFMEQGVKNVMIKLGVKGAYYATEGAHGLVPVVKDVKVKDAQGAAWALIYSEHSLTSGSQATSSEANVSVLLGTLSQATTPLNISSRSIAENGISKKRSKAVESGCKASASTLEHVGAQQSIPWADDIDV